MYGSRANLGSYLSKLARWPRSNLSSACPACHVGANPDFLLRGPHQYPRMRFSAKESRMQLANATNFDRKSGVRSG